MSKDRVELQRRALEDMGAEARRDRLGRFTKSAGAVSPTDEEEGAVSPTDQEKRDRE